jgi:hypothetical protein
MVLPERSLFASKPVRLNAHDPIAQSRRAATQRRQAAASKAWNSCDKPEWLDKKYYRTKIQPCLVGITAPTIASTLVVSEPYAANIRAGLCIPHPRHWRTLAALVGLAADS